MSRFNFTSPTASAADALQQFLLEQEARKRQAFLDDLNRKQVESQIADRAQARKAQQAQIDDLAYNREHTQLSTMLDDSLPMDEIDSSTAGRLREHGLGGQLRDVQADEGYGVLEDGTGLKPARTVARGGSKYVSARVAADEKAEAAKIAAQERADRDADNRTFKGEQADRDRELKELIARLQTSNSAESRAVANELKRIQIATAEDKLAAAQGDRAKTAQTIATSRSELADLATSLMDDPRLNGRVGAIQGRMPAMSGDSQDFDNQVTRLRSMLSLENRSKLKGSGAISDFEARTLEAAATALSQTTDEVAFRRELGRIKEAMGGGAAPMTRTIRNPATGETRRQTSRDGGRTWQ